MGMIAALAACDGGAGRSSIDVTFRNDLPNLLAIAVELDPRPDGAATVRCAADDDPDDVLVSVATDRGDPVVAGLRPHARYTCTVGADGETGEAAIEIAFDDALPIARIEAGPGPWSAFVSIGSVGVAWVVDDRGRARFARPVQFDDAPFESTGAYAEWSADGLLIGGGRAVSPFLVDARGERTWTAPPPVRAEGAHHDASFVDGGLLELLWTLEEDGAYEGFAIEELAYDGEAPRWTFSSTSAVSAGDLALPADPDNDPFHANAVRLSPDGASVWVSLRDVNLLARIDRASGRIVERVGVDGDVPLPAGSEFYFQHDPVFEADRVRLLDNGSSRRRSSRVVELSIPGFEVLRSWTEEGWYEPAMGGVEEMPDGRWFVTRAHCQPDACPGVDAEGRTELVLVDPDVQGVDWRLRFEDPATYVYRARVVDPCAFLGAGCP